MRLAYDGTTGTFDLALTPAGGIDPCIGNGGALKEAHNSLQQSSRLPRIAPHITARARSSSPT